MIQDYSGRQHYQADYLDGPNLVFVAVRCIIADAVDTVAMLDTGAQWCMLPAHIALEIGCDLSLDPEVAPLSTRLGTIRGNIQRLSLEFPGEEGERHVIEASWVVSANWYGPVVVGWKGCLERLRFGLDPEKDVFYFGRLSA